MEKEDDSGFKARVNKIFGSLSSTSSSSSSSLQSAWSLTDDEIEKREWRRHKHAHSDDDEEEEHNALTTAPPCAATSSSFNGAFGRKRRNHFEDDDDADVDDGHRDDDESEIQASIGLDTTLDNEAEEDEYDKIAEGRENAGERLYMSAVTDHGPYLNSHNVLPDSVHDAVKDTRANHFAAKARLEEDKAESLKIGNPHSRKVGDANKPKPALKMKDNLSSSKGQRRVRFDPYCKNKSEEGNPDRVPTDMPVLQTTASDYEAWVKNSPAVPDYVLNPSKYTRYSFDSTSEVSDMEVIKSVEALNPDEVLLHHPKFTPRKKESGAIPMDISSKVAEHKHEYDVKHRGSACSIAAGENETIDNMDVEDEQDVIKSEAVKTENQKPTRRYRPRPKIDDPIS